MFPFSVKVLLTTILTTVNQSVLTFIFGRLFPITTVGIYNQANKWTTMGHSFVSSTMGQVAQPVLKVVVDDQERELRVFRKMIRFTAFISFPALFGLAMVAHEFILLTITDKWAACVPLLQILCVGGAFLPFYSLFHNMAISHRRSDIFLRCSVLQIFTQLIIILLFHRWGITTMVIAYSVFNAAFLLVWHFYTHRLSHLRLTYLMKDIIPFMLIALGVMAVTYHCTQPIENMSLVLAVRIVIAGSLYLGILKFLHAEILTECLRFAKEKFKEKK
jgi:O-antigen/teichoic acid export membrane protein